MWLFTLKIKNVMMLSDFRFGLIQKERKGMLLTRTSPKSLSTFRGGVPVTSGLCCKINSDIISNALAPFQAKTRTNAHNKPIFFEKNTSNRARPPVIAQAMANLKNCYQNPKSLSRLFYHANGVKLRSQFRIALINVLLVMLHYRDLDTGEIGFYNDQGAFMRLTSVLIARYANLKVGRVQRVLRWLTQKNYLLSIRQFKHSDSGQKIGLPSIRILSRALFIELKIDHMEMFRAENHKRKKNEKILAKRATMRLKLLLATVARANVNIKQQHYSEMKRHAVLLDHVAQQILPSIKKVLQNE